MCSGWVRFYCDLWRLKGVPTTYVRTNKQLRVHIYIFIILTAWKISSRIYNFVGKLKEISNENYSTSICSAAPTSSQVPASPSKRYQHFKQFPNHFLADSQTDPISRKNYRLQGIEKNEFVRRNGIRMMEIFLLFISIHSSSSLDILGYTTVQAGLTSSLHSSPNSRMFKYLKNLLTSALLLILCIWWNGGWCLILVLVHKYIIYTVFLVIQEEILYPFDDSNMLYHHSIAQPHIQACMYVHPGIQLRISVSMFGFWSCGPYKRYRKKPNSKCLYVHHKMSVHKGTDAQFKLLVKKILM